MKWDTVAPPGKMSQQPAALPTLARRSTKHRNRLKPTPVKNQRAPRERLSGTVFLFCGLRQGEGCRKVVLSNVRQNSFCEDLDSVKPWCFALKHVSPVRSERHVKPNFPTPLRNPEPAIDR